MTTAGIRDKSNELFQIGLNLGQGVIARLEDVRGVDREELVYKGAMLFFFLKSYKTFQAIDSLWKAGFSEDALILTRTIFELSLQARYMAQDPKPKARLFAEYDPVARYRYYTRLKEFAQESGDAYLSAGLERLSPELLEELKGDHERVGHNYPRKHQNWWGNTIRWLAEHLGVETHARYIGAYWMQSQLTHSGVASVKQYLTEHGGGLQMHYSPAPSDKIFCPQEATLYFLDVVRHSPEALNLKLDDEIVKARESFKNIFGVP